MSSREVQRRQMSVVEVWRRRNSQVRIDWQSRGLTLDSQEENEVGDEVGRGEQVQQDWWANVYVHEIDDKDSSENCFDVEQPNDFWQL